MSYNNRNWDHIPPYSNTYQNNNRKRQRRQATGTLVQNLWNGSHYPDADNQGQQQPATGKSGKKSTAQPRPEIQVPPRGIGPVHEPNINDVLCGRGGRINAHSGNVQFRDMVCERKKEYLDKNTKKLEKAHIAADVVHTIRNMEPGGRFLKEDSGGLWYDIGDAKAIKKVGQALREDAPEVRGEMDGDAGDNKKKEKSPKSPKATKGAMSPPRNRTPPTAGAGTSSPKRPGVGGRQPNQQPYSPLAYQSIAPPSNYAAGSHMQHPGAQFNNYQNNTLGMRAMKPTGAISGAAAAAIQHSVDDFAAAPPDDINVAFGRNFHDPGQRQQGEGSMISGISGPSMLSGMSAISGLTDPISTVSANDNRRGRSGQSPHRVGRGGHHHQPSQSGAAATAAAARMNQLQQIREQWTATGSITMSDLTATPRSRGAGGLSNSLQKSQSWSDKHQGAEDMSLTGNSLMGGGIGNSILGGSSLMGGGGGGGGGSVASFSVLPSEQPGHRTLPREAREESAFCASVASMSIASGVGSLPSIPGSIMSDLSENMIALDLAEPSFLDR